MTDLVLQSNQSSVILRSLADAEVQDISYSIEPSYPLLSKVFREIQSNNTISGAPAGQEVVFNLNKSMLLSDMMIRTVYTVTTTTMDVDAYPGMNMFEWVQVRTNNKTLMTISDAYIIARTMDCPEAKANAIYRRALPLSPTTEVPTAAITSTVTYTPVFSSFFEDIKNSFDLAFYEQLSLACKFNTSARAGFNGDLASATCTLWVWSYRLDDKAADMLRARNQSPTKGLNMLMYNTFTEVQNCTSTTQNTMRLNVNFPVFKTHIMVRGVTTALKGALFKIDSIEFTVGGQKLIQSAPFLVANWEQESKGVSSLRTTSISAVTRNDKKVITLNWGLEPNNRNCVSGAISFNQINAPQIVVNTQSLTTATDYSIYVVHEYWQIATLDGANGSVSVTVNS